MERQGPVPSFSQWRQAGAFPEFAVLLILKSRSRSDSSFSCSPSNRSSHNEVSIKRLSAPGDIWMLGVHRVHCSNALDGNSYPMLMLDQKAAMVFTDPPYNVRIEGNVSGLGAPIIVNF
jgi:hypothetical protein